MLLALRPHRDGRWFRLFAVSATLLAAACSDRLACTLAGCVNFLAITFSSPPSSPWHMEVSSTGPGDQPIYVYDCPDIAKCGDTVRLTDYMPTRAFVTVTYQGRTATTEVLPQFTQSHPGGSACGLGCYSASVTARLP
jgi:hypothetical protein